MASTGVQIDSEKVSRVYASPVPQFQALPASITADKLVQPTIVEYFPKEEMPEVDLKGHTVEELAAAANVSVDVIKAAIKLRQQQLILEKKNFSKQKFKKSTIKQSTVPSESTEKVTTQSTTAKSITTPYVPKKKVVKKAVNNGHKVRN